MINPFKWYKQLADYDKEFLRNGVLYVLVIVFVFSVIAFVIPKLFS